MDGQITQAEGEFNLHQTSSHVDPPPYAPTAAGIEGAAQARAGGNLRWLICALLFLATTINYMDRQVFGLLAPDLQKLFNWNEIQYANIVTCFYATYAVGLALMGGIIDRVGTRIGYALSICIWSRSEEHTSELQSPCNLVCRLLLEKKKLIQYSPLYSRRAVMVVL